MAKQNLLRENLDPDKVFNIGSPLYEVPGDTTKEKILKSDILKTQIKT